MRYVETDDGEEYRAWDCPRCADEVRRYRGDTDILCGCGQWFNSGAQMLVDNWQDNESNWNSDVDDMEGWEIACLRRESADW